MRAEAEMTAPELALVLGTRAALGVGLGMLLANRFSNDARRSIGGTLLLVGVCLAAVLGVEGFGKSRRFRMSFDTDRGDRESRMRDHLEVPVT
jgi:hypothetical protein